MKLSAESIGEQGLCWSKEEVDEAQTHSPGNPSDYTPAEFLQLAHVKPQDRLWVILDEKVLDRVILYEFAANCANRVFPQVSMLDGGGVLSESVASAKVGDPARKAAANKAVRKMYRRLAKSEPSKARKRAVLAIGGCSKADAREAATTAAWRSVEASEDAEAEIQWQIENLIGLVS